MYIENKVYDGKVVGALMGAFVLLGLGTVKNAGKDGGFLGRDVTDEWKGWMQSEYIETSRVVTILTGSRDPDLPLFWREQGLGHL